jgi:hypothetical protein
VSDHLEISAGTISIAEDMDPTITIKIEGHRDLTEAVGRAIGPMIEIVQLVIYARAERDAAIQRAEKAERERDEAVAVLREVEWVGGSNAMDEPPWCSRCDWRSPNHAPDCRLAAVLAAADARANGGEVEDG